MSGIAGIMNFDDREIERYMLQEMADLMRHRGPGDAELWTEQHIGLAFRRLTTTGLNDTYPPLNHDGECIRIVFDGEVYNDKELRSALSNRGHQFRTRDDAETIVRLYEEYGEECVHHLKGMFSFAIWDPKKHQLFGARDHFGIKPFYYCAERNRFLFASEIKSIIAVRSQSNAIRKESLLNYLTFQYVPDPHTMFEGIHKLPPAHYLTITREGKTKIHRYWDPMFEPVQRPFSEYVEQIRLAAEESVKYHTSTDVKRGCFLSSGIDSTAIAAMMKRIEPIRTFSVGFEGANNETVIAKQTADILDSEHYSQTITRDDFFRVLPKAIWHQDEPVADPAAIALFHVVQLARKHVPVALSGEGADELFGGYRIYREPQSLRPLTSLPKPLLSVLRRLAQWLPGSTFGRNYILRGTTPLEERYLGNAKIFSEDMKAELLQADRELLRTYQNPIEIAFSYYEKTKHLDPVSRMQYIDMNLWLPGDILMKADKMSMAHSLELRSPFLDKDLFDLASRVPASYRLAEGTTKTVFRKAMEGIVPDSILHRPKLGFPVPIRDWLRGEKGSILFEQIEASGIDSIFDVKRIRIMMEDHRSGKGDYSRRIWVLYIFALWHAMYMGDVPQQSMSAGHLG